MPRTNVLPKGAIKPRKAVLDMMPYSPPTGERLGKERFDFNENTLGASPRVADFLKQQLSPERLAVYPDYTQVRRTLSEFFGVPPDRFLLTNGTDEAIQVLINTYVNAGEEVLVAKPSYAMYRFYSELAGAKVKEVCYRPPECDFPLDEFLQAITPETKAVLISNPNNPTGSAIGLEEILKVLRKARHAVVLVDEAYYEFYGTTALGLIEEHPHLFVSRTFSKVYGMAAMRMGSLFSHKANVQSMHKAQSPYSVNMLAAMAAEAAVQDTAYVQEYIAEALAARELLKLGLEKLGIGHARSSANFVLGYFGERAIEVRDGLKAKGILVRDRSYEIPGGVRITVGTREQAQHVLNELEKIW